MATKQKAALKKAASKTAAPINNRVPKGALTLKETIKAFGVAHMTVYAWRLGTPTKDRLPSHSVQQGKREVLYFKPSELKTWAKKNGVEITLPKD